MSAVASLPAPAVLLRDGAAAIRIAAALLGVSAVAAVIVAVAPAGEVRDLLGFGFAGVEDTVSETASILANNLRLLVAVLLAGGAAQLVVATSADGHISWPSRAVIGLCDAALLASAVLHAVVVGAAIGAYGGRMVAALLPHGPLELSAYSLALALYVRARRERIGADRWLTVGACAVLLLALAAPLEVYLAP